MKLCPKCKNLANLNPYFGVYECSKCNWEEKDSQSTIQQLMTILSTLSEEEIKTFKQATEKFKSVV